VGNSNGEVTVYVGVGSRCLEHLDRKVGALDQARLDSLGF
jgi:hypothetical protein